MSTNKQHTHSLMRICFSATLRYATAMSRPNFTEVYYFSHAVLLPPDGATITIIPFLKTSPFSLRSLLLEQSRVPSTYACNENISFHIRNVLLLFPCYCYTCDLCYLVRVEPNGSYRVACIRDDLLQLLVSSRPVLVGSHCLRANSLV